MNTARDFADADPGSPPHSASLTPDHEARLRELHTLLDQPAGSLPFARLLDAVLKRPDNRILLDRDPKTLHAHVQECARLFQVPEATWIASALMARSLLTQKPQTLHANIRETARLCAVDETQLIAAALKQPSIFASKPQTIHANIEATAKLLGVSEPRLIAAALAHPPLFTHDPATLHAHIRDCVRRLGTTTAQFATAALRQPNLLSHHPETLHANIRETARLCAVGETQLAAAALKQPSIFASRPQTLHANVRESARLLGLPEAELIAAALSFPPLFTARPQALRVRAAYIQAIAHALDDHRPIAGLLRAKPTAFGRSTQSLHARYIIARANIGPAGFSSLISLPNQTAVSLITDHFARMVEQTGKGGRALQVMHAAGIIPDLPSGITPIERPSRPRTPAVR